MLYIVRHGQTKQNREKRLQGRSDLPLDETGTAQARALGERFGQLPTWSLYLITAYEEAQRDIGRPADKNRKIYNGMMKTYYYQFMGPRPPKKNIVQTPAE